MSDAAPRLYARSVAEQHVNLCFCGVGDKQRALDKVCAVLCQRHGASVVRVCVPALAALRQTRRGAPSLTLALLRPVAMLAAHEAAPPGAAAPPPAAVLALGRDALRAHLRAQCARLAATRPRALLVLALDGADHELLSAGHGAADALAFLAALPAVALLATADTLRGDVLRRVLWTFVRADTFVLHPRWKLSARAIPDPASAPAPPAPAPVVAPAPVAGAAGEGGADEDAAPEQLRHLSRVQVRLLRLVDRLCAQDEELRAQQQQQQQQQGARGGAARARQRGRVDTQSVKLAAKAGGLFHSGARAEENLTDLVRAGLVVQCADSALRGVAFWQTTDVGERAVLHLERQEALQRREEEEEEEEEGSESSSASGSSSMSESDDGAQQQVQGAAV